MKNNRHYLFMLVATLTTLLTTTSSATVSFVSSTLSAPVAGFSVPVPYSITIDANTPVGSSVTISIGGLNVPSSDYTFDSGLASGIITTSGNYSGTFHALNRTINPEKVNIGICTGSLSPLASSCAQAVITFTGDINAAGIAILSGQFVIGVNVTAGGYGYTNAPVVQFSGGGGSGAKAFAVVSNGMVTSIIVTNAGAGYTNAPTVIVGPPFYPSLTLALTNTPAATATPIITNGFIVGASLTSGGTNYTVAPQVTFSDASGNGAMASAWISDGMVTNIQITNPGSGYSSNAVIKIAPAAFRNIVMPTVNNLVLQQSYQLQISSNLKSWTNNGLPFSATNTSQIYPQYFYITNQNQMFFRTQISPFF